jgi:hypothetical protein
MSDHDEEQPVTTIVREFRINPERGLDEDRLIEVVQKTLEEFHGCGPTPPNAESQRTVLCMCNSEDHPLASYSEHGCVFVGNMSEALVNALPSHQDEHPA